MFRPIRPSSIILPVRIDGIRPRMEDSAMAISTRISCFQYGFRYEKTRFKRAGVTFGCAAFSSSVM